MRKFYSGFITSIILFLSFFTSLQVHSQTTVTVGTGTSSGSTNVFVATSTSSNRYSYNFTIYKAADILANGGMAGLISKLAWEKSGTGEYTTNDATFKLYMKHVSFDTHAPGAQTWASVISDATPVYSSTTFSWPTGTGFKDVTLQTPFLWNGTDNIAVLVDWFRPSDVTGTISWRYTSVTGSNKWEIGTAPITEIDGIIGNRANIQFTITPNTPCVGTPVPGVINGVSTVCNSQSADLFISGQTAASGLTYQWLSSTGGGPFTPIAGATSTTYTTPALTVTTSYAVTVSCGANSATTAPHTVNVSPGLPGGIYTIDGGSATGGTNYQTFADAINALSCGVTGQVTFEVAAGFYDEQVTINEILGASATNNIIFDGNGTATIRFAPVSSARHLVKLDGADFITFRDFNLLVLSGNNVGWVFHLLNGANNNRIEGSTIDITNVPSSSADNSAGIAVAGSSTDINADGNASNNVFTNNTIIGAYQGIIINGETGSLNAVNNVISNNTIKDFYATGIELTMTDGTVISNNDINRANRGIVSTSFTGIDINGGNINLEVFGNRVHSTHTIASSQTGSAYGIYITGNDAPVGSENMVYNNLIYNFNSAEGPQYGMYNSSSNGIHYYHNTIVLDEQGAISDDITRGFYQTGEADNIEIRNNIFSITRGGAGDKYALYFNNTASTIVSNNNVLYVNATPGFVGRFGTTDLTTLADWQTANSGAYDQQSMDVDPVFADPANGNFYPNNSSFASLGANVGITTDITSAPRDASPTPGAYEIIAAVGIDVGATGILLPAQQACYSNAETVTVTIRNYSASTHNFISSPVTISVAVTGPNATTFTPVVVNTGTLAPDATRDVVISTNYNMSATGTYTFSASTSITGDVNALNDAMPDVDRVVEPLVAGTVSSDPSFYCTTGGIPALTLAGTSGGTIQWQESTTGDPGSWTNVGTNTTSYAPAAAITVSMFYRAYVTCQGNGDTSNVVNVSIFTPQVLTTTDGTRCGPGSVALNATTNAGYNLNWYTSATGGAPVATGAIFNTPIINTTTTYYVSASGGGTISSLGALNADISTDRSSQTSEFSGINFDVTGPNLRINSVDIYPTADVGTAFVIEVVQGTTVIATYAGTTTVQGLVASPVVQTVPVSFSIPQGTGYRMRFDDNPGVLRNDGGDAFPYIVPGAITLTSSTGSGFYYYFYNWQVSTACETTRTAVTATITPAPAFDVTNSTTVCNNAITTLQVNSSLADFNNYTWAPATGLYSDPAATIPYTGGNATIVFAKVGTAGTHTYIATANNGTTGCQNIDSLHLTVLPVITVSAVPDVICVSGSTTLSYGPAEVLGSSTAQWFSSPDGTTFTPITNATGITFSTPVLTTTTHYKLELRDAAGTVCQAPTITIAVNNPQILTNTPATRCGPGTVDLAATSSTGATINWYEAETGGVPVATGGTFTTPVLNATTTYYIGAASGASTYNIGAPNTGISPDLSSQTSETSGINFEVTSSNLVINSVDIYPTDNVGSNFTIVVVQGSTVIASYTGTTTVQGSTTSPVVQTVPVNFSIPQGTGYRMRFSDNPGMLRNDDGDAFPYTVPAAITLTSSTGSGFYYYFYNWSITTSCESARIAVTATISPNTGITTQPLSLAVCTGANVTFSVDAVGADLTYQWRKNNANIAGETNSTLVLSAVTPSDIGAYSVVITGLCGNVTSTDANLAVANNNSWLGAVSTDWNTPANWCGGVPTATSDVVITSGTPFAPVVNGIANVRNLSINSGTSLTVASSAFLNIFGDFSNGGTFSAPSGFVAFRGSSNQTIGDMTVGSVIMNGTGGVTLAGNMTIANTLVLTSGNITLGTFDLVLNGTSSGNTTSHIITNSSGSVISNNINAGPVTVPVGPNASGYNPVIISNGQGRNYTVRVATGINPTINNPNRAVNRTWYVMPNTVPSSPVNIVFQFVDADMNSSASATLVMEAAVHNGTDWIVVSPATGVTPSGTPGDRQVGISTTVFGTTVIGNFGAVTFPTATANVDADVTSLVMMPNVVRDQSVLRVNVRRTMKINWSVVDASGRIVMTFSRQVLSGQNDIQLQLSHLAQGTYQIVGSTEKGKTNVLRFIKM